MQFWRHGRSVLEEAQNSALFSLRRSHGKHVAHVLIAVHLAGSLLIFMSFAYVF